MAGGHHHHQPHGALQGPAQGAPRRGDHVLQPVPLPGSGPLTHVPLPGSGHGMAWHGGRRRVRAGQAGRVRQSELSDAVSDTLGRRVRLVTCWSRRGGQGRRETGRWDTKAGRGEAEEEQVGEGRRHRSESRDDRAEDLVRAWPRASWRLRYGAACARGSCCMAPSRARRPPVLVPPAAYRASMPWRRTAPPARMSCTPPHGSFA
jgi:hypothetical protein